MKKKLRDKWSDDRLHIYIWALFITYETVFIGLVYGVFGNPVTYIVHYFWAVCLFYCHARVALPWVFKSSANYYWRLPLVLVGEMTMFVVLSFLGDLLLMYGHILPYNKAFGLTFSFVLKTIYRGVLFMGFSTGYFFVVRYNREKERSAELEQRRLSDIIAQQRAEQDLIKAQNDFLKAQINPHFLFNTLDFIYHRIERAIPEAGESIIILADMMRYAIDADQDGEFVPLEREIEQAESYLQLTRLKQNGPVNVELVIADEVRELCLIPLILLTLVENIFKHGDLSTGTEPARIELYTQDGLFFLATSNRANAPLPTQRSRTGLANISKRLLNSYGNYVTFRYYREPGLFRVVLTLPVERMIKSAAFLT